MEQDQGNRMKPRSTSSADERQEVSTIRQETIHGGGVQSGLGLCSSVQRKT